MGRLDLASDILNALDDFPDTYLIVDSGEKKTFKELAEKALTIYQINIKN
jgi:hypothetical protein